MAINGPVMTLKAKQSTPTTVILVVPFAYRSTYDFVNRVHRINPHGAALAGEPFFIHPRVVASNITSSKSSHVGNFTASFVDPDNFLLRNVMPDDWLIAWNFDNEEDARRVMKLVLAGEPANGFNDGLKFVGRVDSCRRSVSREASNGQEFKRVNITAYSFSELDTPVYYHPLMGKQNSNLHILNMVDTLDSQFLAKVKDAHFAHVNDILPLAVDTILGGGPRLEREEDEKWTPNTAYLVPEPVAKILGVRVKEDPVTYADLLTTLVGVQEYETGSEVNVDDAFYSDYKPLPRLKPTDPNVLRKRLFTPQPILSVFNPMVTPWSGTPVWGIVNSYLNPAINEMYTCLRPDDEGKVVPTLVIRQKPFTTESYGKGNKPVLPHTMFKNLPRWKVDHSMVYAINTGRSRSLGFNYCEVQLIGTGVNGVVVRNAALADGVSATNEAGVRRSGLKPFITTVMVAAEDLKVAEQDDAPNTGRANVAHGDYDADGNDGDDTMPEAPVSSEFGWRIHPVYKTRKLHKGVDLAYPEGTRVPAYRRGLVTFAGSQRGYGNVVYIDHGDGEETRYAHLQSIHPDVKQGKMVEHNATVGYVGMTGTATGPHLHFEFRRYGVALNPRSEAGDYPLLNGSASQSYALGGGAEAEGVSPESDRVVKTVGNRWSELVADMIFESHLKFSGTVTLLGVQAPIVEGDNFEYDGTIYHIEEVTHSFRVNPVTGQREFRTILSLSNGVDAEEGKLFPEFEDRHWFNGVLSTGEAFDVKYMEPYEGLVRIGDEGMGVYNPILNNSDMQQIGITTDDPEI